MCLHNRFTLLLLGLIPILSGTVKGQITEEVFTFVNDSEEYKIEEVITPNGLQRISNNDDKLFGAVVRVTVGGQDSWICITSYNPLREDYRIADFSRLKGKYEEKWTTFLNYYNSDDEFERLILETPNLNTLVQSRYRYYNLAMNICKEVIKIVNN